MIRELHKAGARVQGAPPPRWGPRLPCGGALGFGRGLVLAALRPEQVPSEVARLLELFAAGTEN